jgi:hypothetical protein
VSSCPVRGRELIVPAQFDPPAGIAVIDQGGLLIADFEAIVRHRRRRARRELSPVVQDLSRADLAQKQPAGGILGKLALERPTGTDFRGAGTRFAAPDQEDLRPIADRTQRRPITLLLRRKMT